jgi:GNAT superfamily N-acetyltransferase
VRLVPPVRAASSDRPRPGLLVRPALDPLVLDAGYHRPLLQNRDQQLLGADLAPIEQRGGGTARGLLVAVEPEPAPAAQIVELVLHTAEGTVLRISVGLISARQGPARPGRVGRMPLPDPSLRCRALRRDECWVDYLGRRLPHLGASGGVLVAEQRGRARGWAQWTWYPDLLSLDDEVMDTPILAGPFMVAPERPGAGLVYVASLYVPPRYRGNGILRVLLAGLQRLWLPTVLAPRDPRLARFLARHYPPHSSGGRWRISLEWRGDPMPFEEFTNPAPQGPGWRRRRLQARALNQIGTRWALEADFDLEWLEGVIEEAAARGRIRHADPDWRPASLPEVFCELLLRPADHGLERSHDLRRLRLRRLAAP